MIRRFEPGPRMSQAAIFGGMVLTAGQVDRTMAASVREQTENILASIDRILAGCGSDRSHILSASLWLADMRTFDEMNAVWDAWIDKANPPARATVEARLSSPRYLVEVAVIAAVKAAG